MPNCVTEFEIAINRLWSAEKVKSRDRRFRVYNGSFQRECHTLQTFAAEIAAGHSFCAVLGGCDRDHCGGSFCCPDRKNDPKHCGRPVGYRANHHFVSAQFAAVDSDTGDQRSTLDYFLADPFFRQHGSILYTTLSHTLHYPKCRAVFVMERPELDAGRYRALGNALPPEACEELEEVGRPPEPSTAAITSTQPMGSTPAARYVNTAVTSITGRLAAASAGEGDRYPQIIPAALKLEGLRLAPWLANPSKKPRPGPPKTLGRICWHSPNRQCRN